MHLSLVRPASKRLLLGLVVASIAVVVVASPSAEAAGACPTDLVTEHNQCTVRIPTDPLTAARRDQLARTQQLRTQVTATLGSHQRGTGPFWPNSFVLPEVEGMRIFKEGEGNGRKSYTCGPSASRNLIAALYKRTYGAYRDFGEAAFARWEHTTTAGTSRANVAAALNNRFKQFHPWQTYRPQSPSVFLTAVIVNTFLEKRAVMTNVNTKPLSFWNGHGAGHFNLVYGYSGADTYNPWLRFAEEWDPIYIYGTSRYGNPYGKWSVRIAKGFEAIDNEPIHGVVT